MMIPEIDEILQQVANGDMDLEHAEQLITTHINIAVVAVEANTIDIFAAEAMAGLLAQSNRPHLSDNEFAARCYDLAEAMMKVRAERFNEKGESTDEQLTIQAG